MINQDLYENIWVFAEHNDGKLAPVSAQLLGEGARLAKDMKAGTQLCAVVAGSKDDADEIASQCFQYGANKAYLIANENLRNYTTDGYTKAVVAAIEEYRPEIFLFGATPMDRDLAPRIAARLGLGLTADCTRLDISNADYMDYAKSETMLDVDSVTIPEGLLKQTKPSFGGQMMATMICPKTRPQMATVRPGVLDMPEKNETQSVGTTLYVDVPITEDDLRVKVNAINKDQVEQVSLDEAEIIVAGGRGLGGPEGFDLLQELADKIGGVVATSGAPIDAGWIDESLMIGQTGTIVHPKLYIACGISGSIQHLAGIENSDTIIAINTDPDVPIFEIADYCIVGDLYEVVPTLIEHWDEFKTEL